jgi:ADP-ribose pyrophosphatase YjhB (NUDIX family)
MSAAKCGLAGYRPGVGIMLLSRAGLAFVGHRIRMPAGLAKWQMPQGGIDIRETPRQAALRELREEIGTDRAEILAESLGWYHHDVPDEIAQGIMGAAIAAIARNGSQCGLPAPMATSTSPPSIRNSMPGNG